MKGAHMAIIRRVDPFSGLLNIQRDLDNFFSDFFEKPKSDFDTLSLSSDMPILDVYNEDDKEFVAELHVPGYRPEEVDIRVQDNILEITGRHEESIEDKDKKRTYYMHQSSANFYRSIALPKNINADKLEADFEDGVLRIRAPFNEEKSQTKKISVKAREASGSREAKNSKKTES
jgi:HSP20 family protein